MAIQLTPDQQNEIKGLLAELKNGKTEFSLDIFASFWASLQGSETLLIDLMKGNQPPSSIPGEAESGLLLYYLNNLQSQGGVDPLIYSLLHFCGMPGTQITSDMYNGYISQLATNPGVVAGDGTYLTTYTYGAFDEGWAVGSLAGILLVFGIVVDNLGTLGQYIIGKLRTWGVVPTLATFPATGQVTQLPASQPVSIAVFGDYGANNANAQNVLSAMQSLNPDMYMHLGDVYYGGLANEEGPNLINPFTNIGKPAYTLNSNHEMFDGASGYFGTALASKAFAAQNGASYFALEYNNWVILGLDSAYFDTQQVGNIDLFLNGALQDPIQNTSNPQTDFLNGLDLTGKQILVFTHHNGISLDGTEVNNPLTNQLYTLLGKRYPDYWYYGHIHDGVVYNNPPAIANLQPVPTNTPMLRCCGHAALPYGAPYYLTGLAGIEYFAQTNAGNTNTQLANTIRNGFAIVTLNGNNISEAFYEATLDGTAVQVWPTT